MSLGSLGVVLLKMSRKVKAIDAFRQAIEVVEPCARQDPSGRAARLLAALQFELKRAQGMKPGGGASLVYLTISSPLVGED